MRLSVLREYDNIIDVDQARLPSDPAQDDIKSSLECFGLVSQSEEDTFISIVSGIRGERHLVAIFGGSGHLSIANVEIEGREYLNIAQRVEEIVNTW